MSGLDDLTEMAKVIQSIELPSMSEEIFENNYLPLLIGPDAAVFNKAWLNIARNPLIEVEIKDNDTGKVLFLVPPLCKGFVPYDDGSVGSMLQGVTDGFAIHAVRGAALLERGVREKLQFKHEYANIQRWHGILRRYGHEDLIPSGTSEVSAGPTNYSDIDEW